MSDADAKVADTIDVFYPILPSADWIGRLVPLGIRTVQLRIKDQSQAEVRRQIRDAMTICDLHSCQLIINDYWQDAIELGAQWLHLGQEDLEAADLNAIRAAGIRLGVSTHSEEELAIALAVKPDYVALGPVYETKLKVIKWAPQGLDKVTRWKSKVGAVPLVGIAGITPERAPGVIAAGADSVAVLTDIVTHPQPEMRVRTWLEWARKIKP